MSQVNIYTTPTCGWCKLAKAYFQEKKVKYQEYDVTQNNEAAHEMIHKSGQRGVPVIIIDDEVIVGFDKTGIEMTLKDKGII